MKYVGTLGQLLRFGTVGVASNGVFYLVYLGMTYLGIGYKLAATIVYVAGVTLTFALNRVWSFRQRGGHPITYVRYWLAYVVAYVLNLGMLALFVDVFGYKHQIVQGLLVLGIAVLLFLAQKFWVFREDASAMDAGARPIARQ